MRAEVAPSSGTADAIGYGLEDFETGATTGVWCGRPEATGAAAAETRRVHGGKRALALTWDFSKSPDGGGCFANFFLHRELVGNPREVRFWLYAEVAAKGTPLSLWIEDASGEVYVSRVVVDWMGWKQVTMPVATAPAWDGGDQNRRLDLPAKLFGLTVEYGGPKQGRLILDDIEVTTQAAPRDALLATVGSDRPKDIFWEDAPTLVARVRNYSRTAVPGLRFTLKVTDTYYDRPVYSGEVTLAAALALGTAEGKVTFTAPYGVHRVDWTLADANGVIKQGSTDFSRMRPKCYQGLSAVEQDYLRLTSPFGGVFWQATPEQGSDTGARWIRGFGDDWNGMEPQPGVYRMEQALASVKTFQKAGIETLWLTCLYNQPSFRRPDRAEFAPAMGALQYNLAKALKGHVAGYEIGNEDNGPTKYLYTEVARHGTAGIHAADPFALVANSGTAFCDVNWLKMQADRGLFNWVDALCVHPYTAADSPEKWGVYEQGRNVVALGDELGGMKQLWTTEWGWPVEVPARDRADWVPRHFMIGVAAGYEKHGLYAWDGHFGIYDNGRPFLSAVSAQAMAKFLEGARFAGVLERSPDRWVVVWERLGKPVVVAWSPAGKATVLKLPVGNAGVQVFDLFGNERPARVFRRELIVPLATGPQYVLGAPETVTEAAWNNQLTLFRERMDTGAVRLRANLLLTRMGQGAAATADDARLTGGFLAAARKAMAKAQAEDLDLPGLRWAVLRFQSLDAERRLAEAEKAAVFARRLLQAQAQVVRFAEQELLFSGARRFTAVWPYLYTLDTDGQTLVERLQFVPGNPREVRVRVNSYARNAYQARVSLDLPPGWQCEPGSRILAVPAGRHVETMFTVTCPAAGHDQPRIVARVAIPGKPLVEVPFDHIEIAPAIRLTQEPLEGLLPQTPMVVTLRNLDSRTQGGRLRLLEGKATQAVARAEFAGLAPNSVTQVTLKFKPGPAPAFNEWPLTADIALGDGRVSRQSFNADFACAVRAVAAPAIDGDLADWRDAAPLHLDQAEYAKGSYGLNWSPEDGSATTWVKWDDHYFYFAAVVKDQTFNQNMHGESIWTQDSLQIALARDVKSPQSAFGLALTPQGPEVFRYTAPAGDLPGARLAVVVSQGQAIYEAAIPWSVLAGMGAPKAGDRIRYSLLLNDDDAVLPRRFLERYGGIAHGKEIKEYGYLRLLGPAAAAPVPAPPAAAAAVVPVPAANVVFAEDFEEYGDGTAPDAWLRMVHQAPVPEGRVVAGAGRGGSKAAVFRNTTGPKPYVYLIFVRELTGLEPGARYALNLWAKGKGILDTGGIAGICTDRWGNDSPAYAAGWKADGQWQKVVMPFTAPAGGCNVILRNAVVIGELAIDDITVTRLP